MLRHLHIQNFAIIDHMEIEFSNGLQIITGETGAGKSIIAGSLSLALGERADNAMLLNKNKKCIVEAGFHVQHKKDIERFLNNEGLDKEQELLLRREISPGGKSRAFVNDTPVSLDQLRKLSSMLVDLHQQFDLLSLREAGFQLSVVDALAAHATQLNQYRLVFQQLEHTKRHLEQLKTQQAKSDKENDYHQFLFSELDEVAMKENEFENLEAQLKLKSHAESIKNVLSGIIFKLKLSEQPTVQQMKTFIQQLEPFSSYHPGFPEMLRRLHSLHIELQDLVGEMESVNDNVNYDGDQIEKLNERIHTGYKLFKKHNVKSTAELIQRRDQLQNKLNESLDLLEEIHAEEKNMEVLVQQATSLAIILSANRKAQIGEFEKNVNQLLRKVGMPNARLRLVCHAVPLMENGMDSIEFLFDANKSDRFEPLKKVASGGELSRLMLCIKSLVARSLDMPTLLFDEIDSGISGEAARQVGIILKELSGNRQVICITHQPQIAGKGDAHFYVFKEIDQAVLKTKIRLLDQESRILIIAKMLSGEKPTAAALENARELVI